MKKIVNVRDTFEDGKNLKDRIIKRGYLRLEELNNFMMIYTVGQLIDGVRSVDKKEGPHMWETWAASGIITKEQQKNLKMALTYMKKFTNDVFNNNLDSKSKENIIKKNAKWEFKLMDDYTVQKIYKMVQTKEVQLTQDDFFNLIEAKLKLSCNGCSKDRCKCELRTFLQDHFIPPVNEGVSDNCEYSY